MAPVGNKQSTTARRSKQQTARRTAPGSGSSKSAARKAAARKSTARKATTRKSATRKSATRKSTARKSSTRKASAGRSSAAVASPARARSSAGGAATARRASEPPADLVVRMPGTVRIAAAKPPDLEVTPEVLEFIDAVDAYRRDNDRPFPSWSEILYVLRVLGYRKG